MTIVFHCPKCQTRLEMSDAYAGRKGECKACRAVFQIPRLKPPITPTPLPQAEPELAPVTLPSPSLPPIKRSRSLLLPLLLVAAALVLLCSLGLGGLAAWWLLAPSSSAALAAMDYLPDDSEMIYSIRLSEIENSAVYQNWKREAPSLKANWRFTLDSQVLSRAGVAQLLGARARNVRGEWGRLEVIKTQQSVSVQELVAEHPGVNFSSSQVGGHTLYEGGGECMFLPDNKTVVRGTPETVRAIMVRTTPSKLSPGMQTALGLTDLSRPVALAANLQAGGIEPPAFPRLNPFGFDQIANQAEALGGQAEVATDVRLQFTLLCKDPEAAETVQKLIDSGAALSRNNPLVSKDTRDMFASLTMATSGRKITGSATLKDEQLLGLARENNLAIPFFPMR
jgi:hypothetical protein